MDISSATTGHHPRAAVYLRCQELHCRGPSVDHTRLLSTASRVVSPCRRMGLILVGWRRTTEFSVLVILIHKQPGDFTHKLNRKKYQIVFFGVLTILYQAIIFGELKESIFFIFCGIVSQNILLKFGDKISRIAAFAVYEKICQKNSRLPTFL